MFRSVYLKSIGFWTSGAIDAATVADTVLEVLFELYLGLLISFSDQLSAYFLLVFSSDTYSLFNDVFENAAGFFNFYSSFGLKYFSYFVFLNLYGSFLLF
jgi:hypothetical protein